MTLQDVQCVLDALKYGGELESRITSERGAYTTTDSDTNITCIRYRLSPRLLYTAGLARIPCTVCLAIQPVFCSDLTASVLSIELLDAELYMLGSRWDTVEMLLSEKAAATFRKVLSTYCLTEDGPDLTCFSKMRQGFLNELKTFAQSLPDSQPVVEDATFISYWDKSNCSWTPYMRKLFTASCLAMCWAAHKASDTAKYDMMCPNPCRMQDVCTFKDCVKTGILEHQFKCQCPKDALWDAETHTCIPKSLQDLRNKQVVSSIATVL
ncbi:unnamed protein product [Echinostoma caproni]|uniref:C8 domain-containing protein n=1 Tax=Echinostoma caproni TaxID=27848 RepID=A0A183ARF6_9TREM|nr:unnamed protein product [Echinostoma caproni]